MKIYKRIIQGTKDVYVGKTTKTLKERIDTEWLSITHKIKNKQRLSPVQGWMHDNKGLISIELIEEVDASKSCEREDFWINKFRSEGYNVLNVVTGVDHSCIAKGRATYCYSLDGKFLREFDSLTKASELISISIRAITGAELSNRRTAGGFMWRRFKTDTIEPSSSPRKVVYRILDDGTSDMSFVGATAAARYFKVNESSLSEAITKGTKCVGYRWSHSSTVGKYIPEHKTGVTMYDKDMNKLNTFGSFREASRFIGVCHDTISDAVASEKLSKGYYWRISD